MSTPSLPQRIQIIGPSCAGKTTLARVLGQRLLGGPDAGSLRLDTLAPATAAPPSPAHATDPV